MRLDSLKQQRGGFAMGLIVGLMLGLAVALGVALYVTKVPVPFVNKVPQRTAEMDAAEAEKNRNWDPNSPLYGKNPARPNPNAASGAPVPAGPATTPVAAAPATPTPVPAPAASAATTAKAPASAVRRDPAEILADRPAAANNTTAASTRPGADPFSYFVQAGAFARPEDAETQRAKLAMMGLGAKVTEREQAGRTVYRVRVGPFDKKDDADTTKEKLDASGVESSLVRVQR